LLQKAFVNPLEPCGLILWWDALFRLQKARYHSLLLYSHSSYY